jgi:hypothetical protein
MPYPTPTLSPSDEIYRRAADTLAVLLPADVRAACDRLLGAGAGPRERWAVYEVALGRLVRSAESGDTDDHRNPDPLQ